MLSYLDMVFIGAGFLLCCMMVGVIVLIRSFRPPVRIEVPRQEPDLRPHWDVPPTMQPREEWHAVHSRYDASAIYPGYTGVVHVHGVENGDTFRAMVYDNGSKLKLEKMVRVRS